MNLFISYRWSSCITLYLGLILTTCVFQLMSGAVNPLLEYDRVGILSGDSWRLVSGHLVHLSWYHWFVNAVGILLIIFVVPSGSHILYELNLFIFLSISVGVGLLLLATDLRYYVGLSGVLHGAFVSAIWRSPYYSRMIQILVLLTIIAKIMWEFSSFYDPLDQLQQLGGRVEIRAHLAGVISGFIWITIDAIRRLKSKPKLPI